LIGGLTRRGIGALTRRLARSLARELTRNLFQAYLLSYIEFSFYCTLEVLVSMIPPVSVYE